MHFFALASESGHAVAQFNLGVAYEEGIGVEMDTATAKSWFQKSAALGFAPAHLMLPD